MIKQATQFMQMREATAVLVRDGERVGIFTERDVRERMVLMGLPETTDRRPRRTILITLDREDFLFNALVLMTELLLSGTWWLPGAARSRGCSERADCSATSPTPPTSSPARSTARPHHLKAATTRSRS